MIIIKNNLNKILPRALSLRLLLVILGVSTLLSIVTTSIQIYVDYKKGVNKLVKELDQSKKMFIKPLTISILNINSEEIEAHVKGIKFLPNVDHVALYNEYNELLDERGASSNRNIATKYKVYYGDKSKKENYLGYVNIELTLDQLRSELVDRVLLIFLLKLVKTIIASSLILLAFKALVSNHLSTVADFIGTLDLKDLSRDLSLKRTRRDDDIDNIVDSLRTMKNKMRSELEELDQLRLNLKEEIGLISEDLKAKSGNIDKLQHQLVSHQELTTLGRVVAGVAHEIKNPVDLIGNSVLVASEICESVEVMFAPLVESLPLEEQRDYLSKRPFLSRSIATTIDQCKKIDELINSIMISSRNGEEETVNCDFKRVVSESLALSYHSIRSITPFNVKVTFSSEEDIGNVDCFPSSLSHLFINLFDNALLSVRNKIESNIVGYNAKIDVSIKRVDDEIKVEVLDNGIGISSEHLENIFKPFTSTWPSGMGAGLGLSTALKVAQKHKGDIQVDTKESEFFKIVVTVPTS